MSELDLEKLGKLSKNARDMRFKDALVDLKNELINDRGEDPEIAADIKMQITCIELLMPIEDADWPHIVLLMEQLKQD